METYLALSDYYLVVMEQVKDLVKMVDLPDDFPSVDEFLQNNVDFVKKFQAYYRGKKGGARAKKTEPDENLKKVMETIKKLQRMQAEL